jgi:hypothetical protein
MTIRADSDPRFFLRFLLIGAVCFGFSLWSLYDGEYGYPRQRERALKYQEIKESGGGIADWEDFAKSQGWPTELPGEPKTEGEIQFQFIMAGIAALLAVWCFTIVWRARGRWIELAGNKLTSSWGQSVNLPDVISINKKQWQKKGIARIHYQDGARRGRFVIDDFKYKREPTDKILREIESRVGTHKIRDGYPEGYEEEHGCDESDEAAATSG